MEIECLPTLDTIGVYFTKPLQGRLLLKFFNLILGIDYSYVTMYNKNSLNWTKETKQNKSALTNSTKSCGREKSIVLES